jgi:SAM-dependent methyltransferase
MADPTTRFSNRVTDYVRWRPSYPPELIAVLRDELGMTPEWVVADIGSGPGNLTRLLLDNGNRVFAIEPNREMRESGEALMAGYLHFTSVDGSAEATGLSDASVDLVVAAQAFHWFDVARARVEIGRILRGPRQVAFVWNERKTTGTPFLEAYETLLRGLGTDYAEVRHGSGQGEALAAFFGGPDRYRTVTFPYAQRLNREGLRGRVVSSSYVPAAGQPGHDQLLADLDEIFAATSVGGEVSFDYDTSVYFGLLGAGAERPAKGRSGGRVRGRPSLAWHPVCARLPVTTRGPVVGRTRRPDVPAVGPNADLDPLGRHRHDSPKTVRMWPRSSRSARA